MHKMLSNRIPLIKFKAALKSQGAPKPQVSFAFNVSCHTRFVILSKLKDAQLFNTINFCVNNPKS